MPEEYFDVAFINFTKMILFGRATFGRDDFGVTIEKEIEQTLTKEQKKAYHDLDEKQHSEMQALLSSFVDRNV